MNATIMEFVINNVSIMLDLTHVCANLVTLCRMTRKLAKLMVNNYKNLILIYHRTSEKSNSIFRKFLEIYLKKIQLFCYIKFHLFTFIDITITKIPIYHRS